MYVMWHGEKRETHHTYCALQSGVNGNRASYAFIEWLLDIFIMGRASVVMPCNPFQYDRISINRSFCMPPLFATLLCIRCTISREEKITAHSKCLSAIRLNCIFILICRVFTSTSTPFLVQISILVVPHFNNPRCLAGCCCDRRRRRRRRRRRSNFVGEEKERPIDRLQRRNDLDRAIARYDQVEYTRASYPRRTLCAF